LTDFVDFIQALLKPATTLEDLTCCWVLLEPNLLNTAGRE